MHTKQLDDLCANGIFEKICMVMACTCTCLAARRGSRLHVTPSTATTADSLESGPGSCLIAGAPASVTTGFGATAYGQLAQPQEAERPVAGLSDTGGSVLDCSS